MRLILLGAPGAGKGIQAQFITKYFNIPILSSGDLIRERMKKDKNFAKDVNSGRLVSDKSTMEFVLEELRQLKYENGFILDGIPRTLKQAEILEENKISINAVIYIKVPDDVVKSRIAGRKLCNKCKMIYNNTDELYCECGGNLERREDDALEIVQARLSVYHELTESLVEYYDNKNIVKIVDGNKPVNEVSRDIIKKLEY